MLGLIQKMLNSKKHKATILQIQELAGFLNFLCRAVIPGHAFTARLYSLTAGNLKPHHHVWLPMDVRKDLMMWEQFLDDAETSVYCRPFMDFLKWTANDLNMASDAAKSDKLGFGAYCENDWMRGDWSAEWIKNEDPSIEFLELFALTAGLMSWIHRFQNRRIWLFCDNESVVYMVNKISS